MESMQQWFLGLDSIDIVIVLALLMVSNGLLSTPPSELVWGLAGYAASLGKTSFGLLLISGVFGNVAGTTVLYYLARQWGEAPVRRLMKFNPMLGDGLVYAINRAFVMRGPSIVLVGRCLPAIRSIVSLPAGLAHMRFVPFVTATAVGCLAWGLVWINVGYFMGKQTEALIGEVQYFLLLLSALVVVLVLVWLKRAVAVYVKGREGEPNSKDVAT